MKILDRLSTAENFLTRRELLTASALSAGCITLAHLLRAEAVAGIRASHKAVINLHLDGGPPHLDMIDLKPLAPVEIRGEFSPVGTSIPGFHVCELLPQLASIADRFVFIRSLVGSVGVHDAFQCQSGFSEKELKSMGGRPALGCAVAKLLGSTRGAAPPFVDLMQGRPLVRNSARPGFLGPAYQAFRPDIGRMFARELEEGMKRELAARGTDHVTNLSLIEGLNVDRLSNRARLLEGFDRFRREIDATGTMDAMDEFTQQAVGLLTSGKFADALNLEREDSRALQRYTPAPANGFDPVGTSEGAAWPKKLLLARRLIEAGVRCVSLSLSDFDTHSENFNRMRRTLPLLDHGLHAFLIDLEERGLSGDVSLVAWGEFGRTPKIDAKTAGRHHWPDVGMALLAGGGMQTGQVIGQTDRTASVAVARPVSYQDVLATLYRNLGIDLTSARLLDPTGRPQLLIDAGQPLPEVL